MWVQKELLANLVRSTVNRMDFNHIRGLECSGRVTMAGVINAWQKTDAHKIFSEADD